GGQRGPRHHRARRAAVPRAGAVAVSEGGVVYIVDDEETVRRSVARLVRSGGLRAETFASVPALLAPPPRHHPARLAPVARRAPPRPERPGPAGGHRREPAIAPDHLHHRPRERADERAGHEGRRPRLPAEALRQPDAPRRHPERAGQKPRGARRGFRALGHPGAPPLPPPPRP